MSTNGGQVRAHGFRSTFRDWCAENTNVAREVAEMALAHTVDNEVEAAYRRGHLFENRRVLMDEWAAFCERDNPRPRGRRLSSGSRGRLAKVTTPVVKGQGGSA